MPRSTLGPFVGRRGPLLSFFAAGRYAFFVPRAEKQELQYLRSVDPAAFRRRVVDLVAEAQRAGNAATMEFWLAVLEAEEEEGNARV